MPRRALATYSSPFVGQTYIEKVVQKYAVDLPAGKVVRAGDYVMIKPENVMTHDNTGPVISKFNSIGATRIYDSNQPVFTLDHDVQNKSAKNLSKYASIEAFARKHSIDFYPAGRGIGHQVLVEEGYAFPQCLTVASDSHSNMYGGVACVGTPIVRTDAAALWATGKTWWQVPRMVKVELKGKLAPGVSGKDVIVALCGSFNNDEVLNAAIEFVGDGIATLSIDDRLTIANMTTEWGALAGVFPFDDSLLAYYDQLISKVESRTFPSSAPYAIPAPPEHPRLNRARLSSTRSSPLSSGRQCYLCSPFDIRLKLPGSPCSHIPIQKAYLVSCTNSRVSDLAAAAAVLRGNRVAEGVEFYVAAASSVVQEESERLGDWQTLVAAGAKVLPAGCGPCIGLGTGLLEEGETGISATNRNYKGRMGHPKAMAYLASPAVEAEADNVAQSPAFSQVLSTSSASTDASPTSIEDLIPSFPSTFEGPLLFAPQDNLNTDGIYPGKYTYQDDITLARQAEVVMENYDPSFAKLVSTLVSPPSSSFPADSKTGVVLVSGYNFGTGSSREQAATALKSAGVNLVIAGSFGDIFKRNAINNGLICLESPELVRDLTQQYAKDGVRGHGGKDGELTVQPGWYAKVGMANGRVTVNVGHGEERKVYWVKAVGSSVQELWLCGGLEGFVLKSIEKGA
ncbi:hypothetical protein BS47DRAFT_1351203 [Hydnum rufescens UP504]|uniref:Homoaconitase, mitochondrial n=1 Tax=Hydnum rufescens UP504 TaxID=1448309 RepID=A0A9P6AL38_9AGAM|nr:hypothetical protein BS47DRAFT_1351203 [Hydnum rufescens UP504]